MARSVSDVALMWSVLTGKPVPSRGSTVSRWGVLLRRPPSLGADERLTASDAAEAWTGELERLGARVVEASVPEPEADLWPVFYPRRCAPTRPPSRRARTSTATTAERSSSGRSASSRTPWRRRIARSSAGAATSRGVDLYVAPCVAGDLPPEDCDELEVRLHLAGFLRWVNLIGWAGLAIGNPPAVAPRDETVLAAGLAWERG